MEHYAPCPSTTSPVMMMMTSAAVLMTVKMFWIRAAAFTLQQFTKVRNAERQPISDEIRHNQSKVRSHTANQRAL